MSAALAIAATAFAQPPDPPTHPGDRHELADRYRETAGRILGAALTDVDGWTKLEHLALRTASDTLNRVDPDHFRRAVGRLALRGFVRADMPDRLSHGGGA